MTDLIERLRYADDPEELWLMRSTVIKRIEELEARHEKFLHEFWKTNAENERLRAALEPFAHPDLRLQLGGNSDREGRDAIVFQRNNALLRLRDFDAAAAALQDTDDD